MSVCNCSLAGTAACRTCANNPYAETPPPVRTYTTRVTDKVLLTGVQTNYDRIRQMSDEELAEWVTTVGRTFGEEYEGYMSALDWLRTEIDDEDMYISTSATSRVRTDDTHKEEHNG